MTSPSPRGAALVTGAAARLGEAISLKLADLGYDVCASHEHPVHAFSWFFAFWRRIFRHRCAGKTTLASLMSSARKNSLEGQQQPKAGAGAGEGRGATNVEQSMRNMSVD